MAAPMRTPARVIGSLIECGSLIENKYVSSKQLLNLEGLKYILSQKTLGSVKCTLSQKATYHHHASTARCLHRQNHHPSFRLQQAAAILSVPYPSHHMDVSSCCIKHYSTSNDSSLHPNILITDVDPFKLVASEMGTLAEDIRQILNTDALLLRNMSHYFFDGKGKTFRPLVALLMSKACNYHNGLNEGVLWSQKVVAMVAEMIHTASLVHDDVIDASDTRRGQPSLNKLHGQRRSILTGDYILSQASITLARTNNTRVISILSSILEDLVNGEFMQLGSKEDENERFAHYLKKTYKKTASLIANTCKSVAILGGSDEGTSEVAFQFGRNLGIAFQLVDDLLDFTSCESMMGKPTAADLKLGLATAPVLFAAQEHPDLHALIMRRFSEEGDVEYARSCVAKSNGVEQTQLLATSHSKEAIQNLQHLKPSDAQRALAKLAKILLDRKK